MANSTPSSWLLTAIARVCPLTPVNTEPLESDGTCRNECTQVDALSPRKLLFWKQEKLCAKFYSLARNDFLLSEGRICPSGYRRCGQTLSEFVCIRQSINCPINDFFISVATDIVPDKVSQNPDMFYYVLDLRDGGGRVFYTRDNPDGKILTEDFEFAFERVCLDHTEKTFHESLKEKIFNQYKYVTFYDECQDKNNNYLHNRQYVKSRPTNPSRPVLQGQPLRPKWDQVCVSGIARFFS